jgi:hypothetical protein
VGIELKEVGEIGQCCNVGWMPLKFSALLGAFGSGRAVKLQK